MSLMQARQQSAHRMIARWGGIGQLVRAGVSRPATMARMDYTPRERASLAIDAETRLRISCVGVTVAPDIDLDYITFGGKTYKMLMAPAGPSPDGQTFAFWDVPVVATSLG